MLSSYYRSFINKCQSNFNFISIPQVANKKETEATPSGANDADQPKKTRDADVNDADQPKKTRDADAKKNNKASADVSIQIEDL